jgi:hypothetical protein
MDLFPGRQWRSGKNNPGSQLREDMSTMDRFDIIIYAE